MAPSWLIKEILFYKQRLGAVIAHIHQSTYAVNGREI